MREKKGEKYEMKKLSTVAKKNLSESFGFFSTRFRFERLLVKSLFIVYGERVWLNFSEMCHLISLLQY